MDINNVLQTCTALVIIFNKKETLQEFELLAYEQACRILESTLKDFREMWEKNYGEFENYTR